MVFPACRPMRRRRRFVRYASRPKADDSTPGLLLNTVNADHGRLNEWMARVHGVTAENRPNSLGWRRALEAWRDRAANSILGAIATGP